MAALPRHFLNGSKRCRGTVYGTLLWYVQLGASSSAVEQRTHNPTGRRFESDLAYAGIAMPADRLATASVVQYMARPLYRTCCYGYAYGLLTVEFSGGQEGQVFD